MSPRATIHRNIDKQRADFMTLSHIVDPIFGIKNNTAIIKQSITTSSSNSTCPEHLERGMLQDLPYIIQAEVQGIIV
jgi:hypothetical protein